MSIMSICGAPGRRGEADELKERAAGRRRAVEQSRRGCAFNLRLPAPCRPQQWLARRPCPQPTTRAPAADELPHALPPPAPLALRSHEGQSQPSSSGRSSGLTGGTRHWVWYARLQGPSQRMMSLSCAREGGGVGADQRGWARGWWERGGGAARRSRGHAAQAPCAPLLAALRARKGAGGPVSVTAARLRKRHPQVLTSLLWLPRHLEQKT